MNYKQKYKIALERAEALIAGETNTSDTLFYLNDIKSIFPELAESEDERIRKEILDLVSISGNGNQFEEIKDWLEKQCSQDNAEDVDILHRVSFYSYIDEPNVLYLSGLYVNEECRNKGIGTKILEIADKVAARINFNLIRLKTEIGSNAERLYKKNGYNFLKKEGNQVWLEKQVDKDIRYKYLENLLAADDIYQMAMNDAMINEARIKAVDALSKMCIGKLLGLEKQGGQKSVDKKYTFKSIPRLLDMIEPMDRTKSYCQKLIDSLLQEGYTTDAKIVSDCLKQMNGEKVAMATMDEQKHTDKVEPKFKVGDWIITKYMHIVMQILNNDNGSYKTVETDGTERNDSYDFIERNHKLWTIQDAKDSDILATKDGSAFIFKCFDKFHPECPVAYCGMDDKDNFIVCYGDGWWTDEEVEPATKEQRDHLFQKMKEAGYEWDAKKKELKKLEKQGEQKPDKNLIETWKAMRLEVYQQASGNRHESNYSDDTTKMFSPNDIDEIIEKLSEQETV